MKSIYIVIIAATLVSSGCKKFVEIGAPVTRLVTTNVFSNDNTATAAQLSLYAQLYAVPYNLHAMTGLSADELSNYSTDQTSIDLYSNSLSAAIDAGNLGFWTTFYNYIYQENAVLENLQGSTGVTDKVKQQLSGEALFMRAYFYFYLVNLYGDVPLITSTDYKVNSTVARTPRAKVCDQIIADLKAAHGLLSDDYVDATNEPGTPDRLRPTTWAAAAMLAKTYLYVADYDSAAVQATAVIDNTAAFALPTDLNKVFKANSAEAIWQISPQSIQNFTPEAIYFILTAPPSAKANRSTTVSPQLLSAFEPGDNRRINWIGTYTDSSVTPHINYYFPYKYQSGANTSSLDEYTMMLRLAEQYLIRAEANAELNGTGQAIADLNVIRRRAGLPDYSGPTDRTALLTAIWHERQVELFTEGQRWLDLKRTETVDAVMNVVTPQKGQIAWDTHQQLYPIPQESIQNDVNIHQNEGY